MRIKLLSVFLLASNVACASAPLDGWYTNLFGGYAYIPGNVEYNNFGTLLSKSSFNPGYNAGGRIGFQTNPFRYELEYTFLNAGAKAFQLNNVPQTGVEGYTLANLGMVNFYYDTPEILPAIAPFLGLGIGYGYVQDSLESVGPLNATYVKLAGNTFAYQATVGLTYNFSEYYAVNLAYRYLATPSMSEFDEKFQAHIASVGVVYRFNNGNYK